MVTTLEIEDVALAFEIVLMAVSDTQSLDRYDWFEMLVERIEIDRSSGF